MSRYKVLVKNTMNNSTKLCDNSLTSDMFFEKHFYFDCESTVKNISLFKGALCKYTSLKVNSFWSYFVDLEIII